MKKAIAYARCSTSEQFKSSLGIEAQIEDMKRFAERNNIEIIDFRTEVVSGKYDFDRRPVLKQAFVDASKIKDCYVLTSKIDRLSRKSSFINGLMDKGAKFVTAESGMDCSPLEISLRAAFAQEERRKIGERTKAAFAAKRVRGEPMGMHLPKVCAVKREAIERSVTSNIQEANSFAEYMRPTIERMRNTGMTLTAISNELNLHGFKTQREGKWYPMTVKNIITRWQNLT